MNYEQVFSTYGGILRNRSRRFSKILGLPFEDVFQEASLALYRALPKYDPQRGAIEPFIDVNVRYHLRRLKNRKREVPASDGLIDYLLGARGDASACQETIELTNQFRALQMRLLAKLNGKEKQVWSLLFSPSEQFQSYLGQAGLMEPTQEMVASFLGVSLETVKWSLSRIRRQMTLILDTPDFSDLTKQVLKDHNWPVVRISQRSNDVEFVRDFLKKRGLNDDELRSYSATGTSVTRTVCEYDWGIVMFLTHGDRHATIVCEGRFKDDKHGRVSSKSGYWRNIADSLAWYRNAKKALKAEC